MTRLADLPALADALVYRNPDPAAVDALAARLGRREDVELHRAAPDVLLAVRPLPGRREGVRAAGETAGVLVEGGHPAPRDLPALVEAALSRPGDLRREAGDVGAIAAADGGLCAVRSCGGLVPLWTWDDGERAAVATTLTALLGALPAPPRLDEMVCAMWATGQMSFPDDRTMYEGIRIVPRGHAATWRPGRGWRFEEYWDPRPADGALDPGDQGEELRELLLATLEEQLAGDVPNLLALSGGVDSSALAAIAGGTLGRPLVTATIEPADERLRARERAYVDNVLRTVRHGSAQFVVWDEATWVRLRARRPRLPLPIVHPVQLALPELLDRHEIGVYFGGEFADDVCGHWWRIHDWIDRTGPLRLARSLPRLPEGAIDVPRWLKWRLRSARGAPRLPLADDLLPIFRDDLRAEYRDWLARERERVHGDERPNRHLASTLRHNSDSALAMNWEVCSHFGIRRAYPFHTRAMLELGARGDARRLLGPGTKRGLRSGLASLVPDFNLRRPDKGQWGGLGWAPSGRPPELPEAARCLIDARVLAGYESFDYQVFAALQTLCDLGAAGEGALAGARGHSNGA